MMPSVLRACSLRVGMQASWPARNSRLLSIRAKSVRVWSICRNVNWVLICHLNRHQRSTVANPRNSRNLRRCPLVSSKCEWPTSVLACSAWRKVRVCSLVATFPTRSRQLARPRQESRDQEGGHETRTEEGRELRPLREAVAGSPIGRRGILQPVLRIST
jgi:hypothetical protein